MIWGQEAGSWVGYISTTAKKEANCAWHKLGISDWMIEGMTFTQYASRLK